MEPFITPHFCETMYCHYDGLAQLFRDDPARRAFAERVQQYYLTMHEYLVSIHQVIEGLPIQIIES